MGTYYIAKTGNDTSGNGTSAAPWKTLNKAVESVAAGTRTNPTVIIVKNGNYNLKSGEGLRPGQKKVQINKAWVTIRAETMHGAVLRGDMPPGPPLRPDPTNLNYIGSGNAGAGSDFLSIMADGVCIDGLVIECIGGAAIGVGVGSASKLPDDIVIQNNITYWTRDQGINLSQGGTTGTEAKTGARCIVRNNRCCCASVVSITDIPHNPNTVAPDPSTAAIRVGYMKSGLVENNVIDHCFGEGMDVGKYNHGTADEPTIIRGNIIHDTSHVALYLLWSRHVHVYNNLVYHTKNSGAHQSQNPYTPGNCLTFRDEKAGTPTGNYGAASGEYYSVYNNLCVNGNVIFQVGTQTHLYIGFNTFVSGYYTYNADVIGYPDANGIFENNVIVDAVTQRVPAPKSGSQGAFRITANSFSVTRQNAWSYPPGTAWRKAGDVYGATSAAGTVEAKKLGLVNPTRDLATTGWGYNYQTFAEFDAAVSDNFNPADYHLTTDAPPRNKAGGRASTAGVAVPLLPFQQDYRGAARDATPDMGFHEAAGQVTVRVEAAFSAIPGGLELETGTGVAFTNESIVTGTTVSGYTWTVKRGAVTQATATTADFNYIFPTAGTWTVSLLVTTPAGSDTETATYTISDPTGTPSVDAVIVHSPAGLTWPVGTSISFADNSTYTLSSFSSRLWEVKTSPGGTLLASSTASPWLYQFNTVGTFTVKLTVNGTGGVTDSQTLTYTITAAPPTVTADFTASDADLVVDVGDSITFTNTSSATGTTITGYEWKVTRVESETFTSTNLTYTFNEAGGWLVRLIASTAAGITAQKHVFVTVRSGGGGGEADFVAVPKTFALNTSTGVQTVTAAALGSMIPRGVHLKVVGATAVGTAANGALWSEGAAASGAQWCFGRYSADGQAVSVAKRARSDADLFLTLDGAGITGRGSFVRFVPGGMEINITDAPPAAYLAEATFYAGETCQFAAGQVAPGAVGVDTYVTVGFAANAIYLASSWAEAEGVVEADADMSRGWATFDRTQMHLRNEDRDAQDTTSAVTRHIRTRIASSADGVPGFTNVEVADVDNGGFSLGPRGGGSLWRPAGWFAFATGGPRVRLIAATLSTSSPSSHPLDFDAQTVMALTSTMRSDDTQLGGVDAVGQGWWVASIHDTVNQSLSFAQAVGAATSATRSLSAAGFRAVNHDGANLWNAAGSLSASGVSLTWTTAPAYEYRFLLLAIEKGTTAPVTDDPVARFEADLDIDARSGRVAAWFDSSSSSGNGETITGWLWDFGDGATSTEANPFHLYETPGSYDVTLTVTTAAGSATTTRAEWVVVAPRATDDYVVTISRPLTAGGNTDNLLDDNLDHSHAVRLNPAAHFRALSGADVEAFLAASPDEAYALVAYDQDGHRFLIKETDGTHRAVATTAV